MSDTTPETPVIHLDVNDKIAVITLNRPAARNSLDLAMGLALRDAVAALQGRDVRAVVICSSGQHFMVGGDVKRFDALLQQSVSACTAEVDELITAVHQAVLGLVRLPCPVLGLINGSAAGFGMSLALACDLLLAADNARFVMAYGALGATPDGGATWHLSRRIGVQRAMAMALLNTQIDAEQARQLGLVMDVVPLSELQSQGMALAQRLASGPAQAQAGVKRLLHQGMQSDLETALDAERASFLALTETADFAEGVRAFCERRPPRFGT